MNRPLQTAIRWLLTIGLLYGVYTETGPFTVIAFGLVFVFTEIATLLLLNTGKRKSEEPGPERPAVRNEPVTELETARLRRNQNEGES